MQKAHAAFDKEHVAGHPAANACQAGAQKLAVGCDAREESRAALFHQHLLGGFESLGMVG